MDRPEPRAIWSGGTTLDVAGRAWNSSTTRKEAPQWTTANNNDAAGFNRDSLANADDYDAFDELFDAAGVGADLNHDGVVNGEVHNLFAGQLEAGCSAPTPGTSRHGSLKQVPSESPSGCFCPAMLSRPLWATEGRRRSP